MTPPTVVILGCGYAGALLALSLEPAVRANVLDLVVVDRRAAIHHKIGSIRASVMGGEWTARTQIPMDHIRTFARHVRGEVSSVDDRTKQVIFKNNVEQPLSFDVLVVATGTHSHSPGENLSSTEEITEYFDRLSRAIARAKDVVIVGGGPSAIEFAGEIRHQYPADKKSVRLVCSSKQLMSSSIAPLPQSFHRALLRRLRALNIDLILEEKVIMPSASAAPGLATHRFAERITVSTQKTSLAHTYASLRSSGGAGAGAASPTELTTDLLLWSVSSSGSVTKEGCFPSPWLNEIGELRIGSTFQLDCRPDVFAVGDVCSLAETKQAVTLPGKMKLIAHNVCRVAAAIAAASQQTTQLLAVTGLKQYQVSLRPTMYIPMGPSVGVSSYRGFTFGSWATSRWKGRELFTEMFWRELTRGLCVPPPPRYYLLPTPTKDNNHHHNDDKKQQNELALA